ncbi:MAG: hypothetical protein N3A61_04580, partial [Ignavibacteria bacterium]|nr:hypothetical protein [Ignavibacteria bacterium]
MRRNKVLPFIFFFTFISFVYAQLPAPTNLTAVYKGGNISPGTPMGYVELKWAFPVTSNVMFKVWRKVLPAGDWTNIKSELRATNYQDFNITG